MIYQQIFEPIYLVICWSCYFKQTENITVLKQTENVTVLILKVWYYLKLVRNDTKRDHFIKINNIWSMTCNSHKTGFVSKIGREQKFYRRETLLIRDVPILHYFAFQWRLAQGIRTIIISKNQRPLEFEWNFGITNIPTISPHREVNIWWALEIPWFSSPRSSH